jgi:hypothetical protein
MASSPASAWLDPIAVIAPLNATAAASTTGSAHLLQLMCGILIDLPVFISFRTFLLSSDYGGASPIAKQRAIFQDNLSSVQVVS